MIHELAKSRIFQTLLIARAKQRIVKAQRAVDGCYGSDGSGSMSSGGLSLK